MAYNFTCWCNLTTFGHKYILVTVCWFSSFWRHFDLVKQVKFAVSRHFLENAWEEWAEICHADLSSPLSELIRFWSWSFDFPFFFHVYSVVLCQSDWPLTAKGATAIRYLDLVVHLYLVISEEMKKAKFSIWKLSSRRAGGIPDCCVVRHF